MFCHTKANFTFKVVLTSNAFGYKQKCPWVWFISKFFHSFSTAMLTGFHISTFYRVTFRSSVGYHGMILVQLFLLCTSAYFEMADHHKHFSLEFKHIWSHRVLKLSVHHVQIECPWPTRICYSYTCKFSSITLTSNPCLQTDVLWVMMAQFINYIMRQKWYARNKNSTENFKLWSFLGLGRLRSDPLCRSEKQQMEGRAY